MSTMDTVRLAVTAILVGRARIRGLFPLTVLAVSIGFLGAALHGVDGLLAGRVTLENVGFVALGALLAPMVLASRFRVDQDGIHRRTLLKGWRTIDWDEVTDLIVPRGIQMTTPLEVRTTVGGTETLHAAGGAAGCTRPLLLLAAAAEQGLVPDHVSVELVPRPIWPEAARAVQRLEAAGVTTTRSS